MHTLLPILALLLTACATQPTPTPSPAQPNQKTNLLQNPSLESDAPTPWYNFADKSPSWHPFTISDTIAHSDSRAAHLHMDSDVQSDDAPVAIHGIVQEIQTPSLPAYISGHYQVQNWTRATKDQYLQLVVMATRPRNKPQGTNFPTYQLAIPLAGITEPPFTLGNRKFAFNPDSLPPEEPTQDEWVFFEYNLADLYKEHWGFIPQSSASYRVFFEVRYDNRDPESDQPARADVYFDTLYLGPDSCLIDEARSE